MARHSSPSPAETSPPTQPAESLMQSYTADALIEFQRGGIANLSLYEPLLSAEEATSQTGFPIGPLQAVIRLPYKFSEFAAGKTPDEMVGNEDFAEFLAEDGAEQARRRNYVTIYCFQAPETVGRHSESGADFYLMGEEQVRQYREQAMYAPSVLPETSSGVLALSRGESVPIGRGESHWLPNVGFDYTVLKGHDNSLRDIFSAISRDQAVIGVDEHGQLILRRSENSHEHWWKMMTVEVGKQRSQQQVTGQLAEHSK